MEPEEYPYEKELTRLFGRMCENLQWRRVCLQRTDSRSEADLTEALEKAFALAGIAGAPRPPRELARLALLQERVTLLEAPLPACRRLLHQLWAAGLPASIDSGDDAD